MNGFQSDIEPSLFVLHLSNGEDLLESIKKFLLDRKIQYGVIVSGIGTLSNTSVHAVVTPQLPAIDEFYTWNNQAVEFTGLSGIIADYEPHLHFSFCAYKDGIVVNQGVGHVELGCKVLCLAEIAIMKLKNVEMARVPEDFGIYGLHGKYKRIINDSSLKQKGEEE